jgi:hypothetical protein
MPVLVPWSMISAATATQVDDGFRPALLLVSGETLPLMVAAKISSPEESGTIKIINDRLVKDPMPQAPASPGHRQSLQAPASPGLGRTADHHRR